MGRIEKTVFISYRRTNFPWALAIYKDLHHDGYDVFFDYLSINSGDFEKIILENIKGRAHFIAVLTPSALERCNEPGDWFRLEIETALDEKRNIVPLMLEGFDFGSPTTIKSLTGKLLDLKKYSGLGVPAEYFDAAMKKLRERYLDIPLEAVLHPISDRARQTTLEQKSAANKAMPVEKEQLTAQEWFERGYVFQNDNKLEEAFRCYTEAIGLDPYLYSAYNNLGILFYVLKRYEEAEAAYRKAIELDPSYDGAYSVLGILLSDENLKRYSEAEAAYRKAIELDPSNSTSYYNLGNLLSNESLKRYEEAEAVYRKAIELNPSDEQAYYNLGNLLSNESLKRYEEAEAVYRKAIELNPSDEKAYYNLAITLRLINRTEDAMPLMERIIEINPGNFNPYLAIASINKQLGRGISSSYVTKARQLMPEEDWYNRACLESVCDNFDGAFEYLQKAMHSEKFRPTWAWVDPDLQWLRHDPRFINIIGKKSDD